MLSITIQQRETDYLVFLTHEPSLNRVGKTIAEAIGKLILSLAVSGRIDLIELILL
jgi:hypothetical protein